MNEPPIKDNLLVSAVNGGGVLLVSPDGIERWSRVDTTGATLLPGGGVLLARQAEGRAEIRRLADGSVHRVNIVDRSLDLHDLWADEDRLLVVATHINTVFEFDHDFREIRHWSQPGQPDSQHVNSVCVHGGIILASRFGTFFEHRGYKGRTAGAGSVVDLAGGKSLLDGLSQPHSLVSVGEDLWLCNSEVSEVRRYQGGKCMQTITLDGYTRGLALVDDNLYVGLSRSRNAEIGALASACIVVLDPRTGNEKARVQLPVDEVYAIQPIPPMSVGSLRDSAFADAVAEYDTQVDLRLRAIDAVRRERGQDASGERLHEANLRIAQLEAQATARLLEWREISRKGRVDARRAEERRRWIALRDVEVGELREALSVQTDLVAQLRELLGEGERSHGVLVREAARLQVDLGRSLDALRQARVEADALRGVAEQMRASRRWRWTGVLRGDDPPLRPRQDVTELLGSTLRAKPALEPFPSLPAPLVQSEVRAASRLDIGVPELQFPDCTSPLVSIIVPAWGGFSRTLACLESIMDAAEPVDFEVILVEDASEEAEMERFAQVPGLRYVRNASNLGFLRSVNNAASLARGAFIHLLNNDTLVQPGWLHALLRVPQLFHDFGAAGTRLVSTDGTLQEAGGVVWSDGQAWNVGRGEDAQARQYQSLREVDYVSAASMLVRTDVFRELGGFDDRYAPAYYEDTDLAFRLRERGLRTFFQPASVVVHEEGGSHGTDVESGGKAWQQRNRGRFVERWHDELVRTQLPPGQHPFLAARRAQLRKSVLVIDRHAPHTDRDAGSRAIWHLVRAMQVAGFDVLFWSATPEDNVRYRALLTSHGVEYLDSELAGLGFSSWLKSHGAYIDHVVLSRPEVAATFIGDIRETSAARVVLYGHDIHYLRMQGERAITGDSASGAAIERMMAHEHKLWRDCDVVLYPSEDETRIVSEVVVGSGCATQASTMPLFGLPPRALPQGEAGQGRSGLLFVGGFSHAPNRDAMFWFHGQIWPLLREANPDLVLRIVGAEADEELLGIEGNGIEFAGSVDDGTLDHLYDETLVAIVPLRFGAGVKGKVLEALQNGVPCVTTAVGAQGLADADALQVANDPAEFARQVQRLLDDREWWNDVSGRGQSFIERNYSVAALGSAVAKVFGSPGYPDVATRLQVIEQRCSGQKAVKPRPG